MRGNYSLRSAPLSPCAQRSAARRSPADVSLETAFGVVQTVHHSTLVSPYHLMAQANKILVVDDTPHNVKLLVDLLGAKGYEVVTAKSGEEALEKIAADMPDLVLLDVVMPGLSGYDVLRKLRDDERTKLLGVVIVTSLDAREEKSKGFAAGANDFLSKPIDQTDLLLRVQNMLHMKSQHDVVQKQKEQLADLNRGLEERVQQQVGQLEKLSQLKRFFPPKLVEMIIAGDVEDPLKTHRREVTVAFLDLRGFTAFADASEPEEVIGFLRDYHREMGRLIDQNGGTLEQFAGDSLMVIFNDPVEIENPAACAIRMAIEMRERFGQMMHPWKKRGHDIGLGIGIAHGYATIGAIGFESRIGYGVIGRVTNLAARLCSEAKEDQILISQQVFALVEDLVEVEAAEQLTLKGFARPVSACNVIALK